MSDLIKIIQVIFGLIFIVLSEIIKFFIKRPIISSLLIFGLWVSFVPVPLPDDNIITEQSQIEKNFEKQGVLKIYGGDGFGMGGSPSYGHDSNAAADDRGTNRAENLDPKPKFPIGTGASGNPGSSNSLSANKIPDPSEWDVDPKSWIDNRKDNCQDSEKSESLDKLPVPVNFKYVKDSNGNPTLLIPNIDLTLAVRSFNKVEYDQTASHLHHAPEMGIPLPKNFDLQKYKLMSKSEKINYAKQNVSKETIIFYQNAIGMAMNPTFGIKTRSVPGFAGIRKTRVDIVIQDIPNSENHYLSVIRDDGTHISSYPVISEKLLKIAQDNFWIWKDRNFN